MELGEVEASGSPGGIQVGLRLPQSLLPLLLPSSRCRAGVHEEDGGL